MKKIPISPLSILFLFATCCLLSFVLDVFSADYLLDDDPRSLESSARYNYYLGQYYYSQGRFNNAEEYFQRSRDLMERKRTVESQQQTAVSPPVQVSGGGGGLEYTVGEGDVLYITVWQNDDLDQEAIVRPDGRISFPLVGDLRVAGLTLTQIDADLTQRLKEFIKSPEVSISIRKLGGSKVIILGQVMRPGVYAVSGNRTILEAVALAGGFTQDAVANSVVLVRGGLQNPRAERLNLKRPLRGTNLADNIPLQSEDIIFVPRTFISDLSYVLTTIIDPISRGSITAQTLKTMFEQK